MSQGSDATVFIPGRIVAGTRLNGVYEVESSLAPGGMGEVYKGHEIFSSKKVALKFIRRELEENPDARQMFVNEGNSLSELHHDAIVRCYPLSVDPTLQRLYLPMEFVEGPSLFDLMQIGPLTVEQATLLLKRMASGLQAAHERNIFHRDVSPDNIIVPDRDVAQAKIIDFGIARSTRAGSVTVIGSGFAGKHNYVSPEQCGLFGGDVLAQSDIYSLGLVLAGALLGQPLDMGGSLAQVTMKRQKVPDLSGIAPAIRPVLDAMLQPDPAARPASMNAVLQLLASPPPRPVPAPRRSRTPLVAAAAGIALALAGAAFYVSGLWRPALKPEVKPADDVRAFVATFGDKDCVLFTTRTTTPTSAEIVAFAPDGPAVDNFTAAFGKKFAYAPTVTRRGIAAPDQCAALRFARSTQAPDAAGPSVTIISPAAPRLTLKAGKILSGAIAAPAGASVALLRIDENGTVQDLSDTIKSGATERTFLARLDRSPGGPPGPQPQLLLALQSTKPINLPPLPAMTEDFFAALPQALTPDMKVATTAAGFDLEK